MALEPRFTGTELLVRWVIIWPCWSRSTIIVDQGQQSLLINVTNVPLYYAHCHPSLTTNTSRESFLVHSGWQQWWPLATTGPKTPSLTVNVSGGGFLFHSQQLQAPPPLLLCKCKWGGFLFCSWQLQAPPPSLTYKYKWGGFLISFLVITGTTPSLQMQEGGFSFILLWATTPSLQMQVGGSAWKSSPVPAFCPCGLESRTELVL